MRLGDLVGVTLNSAAFYSVMQFKLIGCCKCFQGIIHSFNNGPASLCWVLAAFFSFVILDTVSRNP
jgi:hypothetical protein